MSKNRTSAIMSDIKMVRAGRRSAMIAEHGLDAWRMPSKRIAPKRGKGAPYDRRANKSIG